MRSLGATAIFAVLMLGGTAQAEPKDKKTYAKCSVPIVLKGTIVAEGRPEWSQAQIDDSETKSSRTFTLKKPWIRSGVKMVEIGEGFITVEVGKQSRFNAVILRNINSRVRSRYHRRQRPDRKRLPSKMMEARNPS